MKTAFIVFFTFLSFLTFKGNSQSVSFSGDALGYIVLNDFLSGSCFVMLKPNYVVTCAHVVDSTKSIFFFSLDNKRSFKLKLIKYDIDNDLALLESESNICLKPFQPINRFDIRLGQHLFYLGYNSKISSNSLKFQVDNAIVDSIGQMRNGNTNVDYFLFNGVGIPGYSGGPVLNDLGQIVGVMQALITTQNNKGDTIEKINRAFSIVPILH